MSDTSDTLELLRKFWDSPLYKYGWTPEKRAAQAERCRQNQPWVHSTGPRTEAGKARSRLNGWTSRNKRDAKKFDILASLVTEVERLKQENIELRSKVNISQTNPM